MAEYTKEWCDCIRSESSRSPWTPLDINLQEDSLGGIPDFEIIAGLTDFGRNAIARRTTMSTKKHNCTAM
jgi:hypothetical protein